MIETIKCRMAEECMPSARHGIRRPRHGMPSTRHGMPCARHGMPSTRHGMPVLNEPGFSQNEPDITGCSVLRHVTGSFTEVGSKACYRFVDRKWALTEQPVKTGLRFRTNS